MKPSESLRNWLHLLLVCGAAFGPAACSSQDTPCVCDQSQAPPVDTALMAYLSKARSLHHEADQYERSGQRKLAVQSLEKLASSPLPGASPMQEAREVLADTHARIAELKGQLGDHDASEQAIKAGLENAPKDSYFEGHLFEVRGVNEERRAESLAKSGNEPAARQAREAAIKAFDQAVIIQDNVINNELVRDGGQRAP